MKVENPIDNKKTVDLIDEGISKVDIVKEINNPTGGYNYDPTDSRLDYYSKSSNGKYNEEIVPTKNIRTADSYSHKKWGLPLTNSVKAVVLHHTGSEGYDNNKRVLSGETDREVSAHVLIGKDGKRAVFAKPNQVTYHAGISEYIVPGVGDITDRYDKELDDGTIEKGTSVNSSTLGIEFEGDTSKSKLTKEQIESAVEYLLPIVQDYNIPIEAIISHADVSGGRKGKEAYSNFNEVVKLLRNRLKS